MQEIICLLDGSGSMGFVSDEALTGFNDFIKEQKQVGDANLTVAWFNNDFRIIYDGQTLLDYPILNFWCHSGMTALYDAIGKIFSHVRERFTREKPEKVVFVIQTDGLENASREYSKHDVTRLIAEHQSKYGWTIVFLGAGLNVAEQGRSIGVCGQTVINYHVNDPYRGFVNTSNAVYKARTS